MLGLSCITACVSVRVCMPIGLVVAVLLCGGSFGEEGVDGLCNAGPEDGPHCQACGDCELGTMCLLLLTALPTPALLNAPPAAPPLPPSGWPVVCTAQLKVPKAQARATYCSYHGNDPISPRPPAPYFLPFFV